jgi:DNA replication protein DnaC
MSEVQTLCERCNGAGWLIVTEDGVERAKRCDCARVHAGDKVYSTARIPPRYQECEFDNYVPESQGQRRAKGLVMKYAEGYPVLDEFFSESSLLFSGGAGRGKTHLAVAALKILIRKGVPCLFIDFHELLAEIRNSYDERSQSAELEILRPVLAVDVLLLDDLGSQRTTEWVQDTVFHIINVRYNNKKPLLVTTNLSMEPEKTSAQETLQDRLGYRVVSRLYEMCTPIDLDGPDYRKEIRKAGMDSLRKEITGD